MSEEKRHVLELLWKGFNIILFLGLVWFFSRNYLKEAFNNFYDSLLRDLKGSEEEELKARRELEEAKRQLQEAKEKYKESVRFAQEFKEMELRRAKEEAEEVAKRLEERTKEVVKVELRRAKEELRRFGLELALEEAKRKLKEEFSKEEVQRKFVERKLESLN